MIERLEVETRGKGLYDVTPRIASVVERSGLSEGLCTVMIQHTSASLTIQENYDPTARRDLEGWIERLVLEDDPHFTHKVEGPDDMPSHVKAALTSTTLSIPILDGKLALGTWQGVFLWEHRTIGRVRSLVLHLGP
jgi:secondary thiamine-phosphate synthase enzyme